MAETRWDRLANDLAAAGYPVTVHALPYSETVHGRVQHGVTRSIVLRHPNGGTVEIGDAWWNKNPDVWIGWEVTRTGADDFVQGRPVRTKKRSEVVTAIRSAMEGR